MTASESPRPWQEALGEIYRRAGTDADFRQLCIDNPGAAFAAVGNYVLPADVRLRFIEKPEEIVFVLPPLTATDGSISEEDLDLVAGGIDVGGGNITTVTPQVPGPMPYYPYGYPYNYNWGLPGPGMGSADTPTGLPPLIKPGGAPPGY